MKNPESIVKNEKSLTLKKEVAWWARWLHIYLSMFSFAALLFFAVTGITLNHPAWTEGDDVVNTSKGQLPAELLTLNDSVPFRQLETVEFLRTNYRIRSPLAGFVTEDIETMLSFKGPGYVADVFIDNESGYYELTITQSGMMAVMNDLHKGRDTGTVWAALIDISAALMIIVSVTGFVMIFFLRKKRLSGTLLFLFGLVLLLFCYYMFAR